ncbi:30S ribosomal protein S13 [Candidatus Woesearchaeota archaeon]|nr:30S ribosomal protein S13 [Candidatus Woesearchaeota archaeon]
MAEYRHIVRVASTDLVGEKPIFQALRKIKGVSFSLSKAILIQSGIDPTKRAGDLEQKEVEILDKIIADPLGNDIPVWMFNRQKDPETGEDHHIVGADRKFTIENDIKAMKKAKTYKGMRHQWGLPVRGQRTKSNFRRNKGKGLGVKKKSGKSGRV